MGPTRRLVLLDALLALVIFVTDLSLPLGVAGGVPYVAVVMLTLWLPGPRPTVAFATAASALTLAGLLASPPGGVLWMVLTNRGLALVAIWATALPVLHRKRAEAALAAARDELEERVRRRTAELEDTNTRLRRALDELTELTYIASHDLKSAVRAIGTLGAWIERDCGERLDPRGLEHLTLLGRRVTRLNHVIEDVLEWIRIGRKPPSPERVDTGRVVAETVQAIAPPDGIRVEVVPPFPVIRCDRTAIALVLNHLVKNAIQHLGRPTGEVVLQCRDAGTAWEFSVRDDGAGIHPRHHARIFRMFQSLAPPDDATTTGVGLAIVKKVVEGHGGQVRLVSDVGTGSTFYFTIPKEPGATPLPTPRDAHQPAARGRR